MISKDLYIKEKLKQIQKLQNENKFLYSVIDVLFAIIDNYVEIEKGDKK